MPFSGQEWENELSHLISTLVTSVETKRHPPHSSSSKVSAECKDLLLRIKSAKLEEVHRALMGLLMLVYTHPEGATVEHLKRTIHEEVLEKYPLDCFLQAAGIKILEVAECLEELVLTGTPFQYPPFQKAIPYCPSYGYQATLVFHGNKLDTTIQAALRALITKLKG